MATREKERKIPSVEKSKTNFNKYLFKLFLKPKTKMEDKTKNPPKIFGWEKVP